MSSPVNLRIVFGGDEDARKLALKTGIPKSVDELVLEIMTVFGVKQKFRLQYKDKDFGNEYMNLTSTTQIEDRDTLKVIFLSTDDFNSCMHETAPDVPSCSSILVPLHKTTCSSDSPNTRHASPCEFDSVSEVYLSEDSFSSSTETVLIKSPESRTSSWPQVFVIPRFSCSAEIQLQRADTEFNKSEMLLIPPPKLRSDILEGMAEEIFRYAAYPTDSQLDQAAEALINVHPCLREKGTRTGHEGWKHYLKIKMANFRSKLSKIGHPEITVNSLRNKREGRGKAASNIKKPKKAEVNFLPCLPRGETADSMEKERIALLTEVKKNNNEAVIKEKMHLTFSYRRQELVEDLPMVSDLQSRWPALFTVNEINAEFMRITTVPLLSKFFAQLDKYTADLQKVFSGKGGASGQKISRIMTVADKCGDIHIKRDCVIQSLCVYFNEDMTTVVKEFEDSNPKEAEARISETTLGLFVIRKEGAGAEEEPSDVGVVIEGVTLLENLKSISFGLVILFGLIYALNLSYPQGLKFTFEFFQKVLMNLDGSKLSPKVQALKIKMFQ
ncbi:uncharacterized protein [Danio rerio]|uniref:Uncharacterized protein n=2 Tax=Danio rerio TaxID=7955 RepID=A0AC58JAX9_DANRE|nr:sterile alpha motif domain-containing protein 3 [Danio rerio]XP_021325330.1 sterile alpha motif domain-containing protein 3 [Danio rerio]|eukprot:XP_021325329.1 sterile alpha motif domain-containing protein 3 [Danio rerio]